MKGKRIVSIVGWVLGGICIAAALGLVLGLVVQALWNWLMPVIFGLPEITYWQAVGLFILCHLLFSSHHSNHHKEKDSKRGRHDHIRTRIHEMLGGPGESTGSGDDTNLGDAPGNARLDAQ